MIDQCSHLTDIWKTNKKELHFLQSTKTLVGKSTTTKQLNYKRCSIHDRGLCQRQNKKNATFQKKKNYLENYKCSKN